MLIPVLGRPQRVPLLLETLAGEPRARPVFLCSPGDDEEAEAVRAAGIEPVVVPWQSGQGDYARKINYGFAATADEWVLLAADDISFHPGWFDVALKTHAAFHPCVIGTNDLGNARVTHGHHSVYTLVHRDYGECGTIDEPDSGKLLCEKYWHNFVDDEFIETARARETYMKAPQCIIEHLHPHWKKAEWDDTYAKGQEHFAEDRRLWFARQTFLGRR